MELDFNSILSFFLAEISQNLFPGLKKSGKIYLAAVAYMFSSFTEGLLLPLVEELGVVVETTTCSFFAAADNTSIRLVLGVGGGVVSSGSLWAITNIRSSSISSSSISCWSRLYLEKRRCSEAKDKYNHNESLVTKTCFFCCFL